MFGRSRSASTRTVLILLNTRPSSVNSCFALEGTSMPSVDVAERGSTRIENPRSATTTHQRTFSGSLEYPVNESGSRTTSPIAGLSLKEPE